MKIKIWSIGLSSLLLAALVFAWLFRTQPPMVVKHTDLDINSGDVRYQVSVCGLPVKNRVMESSLSREVRRLNIVVPPERVWKPAFVQTHEQPAPDYVYGFLQEQNDCNSRTGLYLSKWKTSGDWWD